MESKTVKAMQASAAQTIKQQKAKQLKKEKKAAKKKTNAKKREIKIQLKMDEAIRFDKEDKSVLAAITKKAYAEGRAQLDKIKRQQKGAQMSKQSKECQAQGNEEYFLGRQSRLPYKGMSVHQDDKLHDKADERIRDREKTYEENFYALDVETSGLKHCRPIQIGAILVEERKLKHTYDVYFKPGVAIQKRAYLTHGLSLEVLAAKDPQEWTT